MFRYLAGGTRDYRRKPSPLIWRRWWEFEAVIAGAIAPTYPDGSAGPLRQSWVWIFPPQHPHGWTGDGAVAQVAVAQPATVPAAIEHAVQAALREGCEPGWAIDAGTVAWMGAAWEEALRQQASPDDLLGLRQEHLLAELSLRLLASCPSRWRRRSEPQPHQRLVDQALAWFVEHLAEGPGEDDLAAAVHCSPVHLRRVFHRVLGESPRARCARLRLDHADRLLIGSDLPMARVAEACGFGSSAAFAHAYRRMRGTTPGATRASRGRTPAVDRRV